MVATSDNSMMYGADRRVRDGSPSDAFIDIGECSTMGFPIVSRIDDGLGSR